MKPGEKLPENFVVACTVCRRRLTLAQFATLPHIGDQPVDDFRLELRNCSCGSTHGLWIDESREYVACPFEE